jgi:hypothetical protein
MKINGYVLKSAAAIGGLLFASIPRYLRHYFYASQAYAASPRGLWTCSEPWARSKQLSFIKIRPITPVLAWRLAVLSWPGDATV